MIANLQEKLTDFLPKLLDCSTEMKTFHDSPKLPSYSTLELCERFGRIMATVSRAPAEGRWAERRRCFPWQTQLQSLPPSSVQDSPGPWCYSSVTFFCCIICGDFILFFTLLQNTIEEGVLCKINCSERRGGVRRVSGWTVVTKSIPFCFNFKNTSLGFYIVFCCFCSIQCSPATHIACSELPTRLHWFSHQFDTVLTYFIFLRM